MKSTPANTTKSRMGAIIKAFVFVVFIAAAIYVIRFTPVKEFFTQAALTNFLESAACGLPCFLFLCMPWGYVCLCQGLCSLSLGRPSSVLIGIFVCLDRSHDRGECCLLDRTNPGREFAASMVGDRLRKYDDAIARNGFAAVLYLRLVYFPSLP